jgi:hypothetical protein
MTTCDLIDVSSAQHPDRIAWQRVRAAGVIGAYVRAGDGLSIDPRRQVHAIRARSAGLETGVYWFARPGLSPVLQADRLAEAHHDLGASLAPACDLEVDQGVTAAALQSWLAQFMARVDASLDGQRAIIYTGPAFWTRAMDSHGARFADRGLWIAHYGVREPSIPYPWDEHLLWQSNGNTIWRMPDGSHAFGHRQPHADAVAIAPPGSVDGVSGEVDCSRLGHASMDDLRAGRQPRSALDLSQTRDRQRALRRLGHDPGPLDGAWGPRSRAALVLAQRALGVTQTGIWSPETESAIAVAITTVSSAR